ncbi:MAG: lasso peptide biosynthesis B2 protein [Acidobacteria bacterium]|nr:lasso peptide biosynthesis B2 protein [Acidobacteriota bacterium]
MTLLAVWLRLPPQQRAMALEAAMRLTLARLIVYYVPMRYWRRRLEAVASDGSSDAGRQPLGRAVGRMVRRVARRLPFEALCLPQAMAAQWMLRRRGVSARLWIGVRRPAPGRPLAYHAWLTVDGESVIGGRPARACVPLPWPLPPAAGSARP